MEIDLYIYLTYCPHIWVSLAILQFWSQWKKSSNKNTSFFLYNMKCMHIWKNKDEQAFHVIHIIH